MHSISRRLLISVAVPLALFFVVMSVVLDSGFRALSERSLHEVLDSEMVALIADSEPVAGGGYAPPLHDLDPRLAHPRSGLFAQVRSTRHQWRSPSTAGTQLDFGPLLPAGAREFRTGHAGHERVAIESRGIQFTEDPNTRMLTFSVAVSLSPYEEQQWRFRRRMLGWFSGLFLVLLLSLAVLLRGVLAPLRRLEREIHEVEEGRSETLGEGWPRELSGVAGNLNALLVGERKRVARYRDTLGNLAHGLKTPLAVMRSSLAGESTATASTLGAEIDRITAIIEHQLRRAAASGGALLGQAPVDVGELAAELRSALIRVYARKDLSLELSVAAETFFIGDRGDLLELLGNLLDNACKWCRSRVRLRASADPAVGTRERLWIQVEDDGPGISDADLTRVQRRGERADETVPGHGLGLAMVRDVVELYGGTLEIGRSELGGARFSLRLPGK